MSQKVVKVQKIKKSKIQNFDFLIRRGGAIFWFFPPNVNVDVKCFSWTKNKLVLKWFLGNFKCFKHMFFSWFPKFKIFPISNFSQIQKGPKHPGGGGDQENCWLFPLFVTFFNLEASLMNSGRRFGNGRQQEREGRWQKREGRWLGGNQEGRALP